ncbi:MAG TPA: DUF4192 domain-containing protein [Nocardioides sp.]|nr:DUF4192 domain-containing protein [Nocardioides sp.]
MPRSLTARCPEDLLAIVPVVLGFEPADSIVMLTLDADRTFHARVDLPPAPEHLEAVVDLLLEPAVRHGAAAVVLVLYTADEAAARRVVRRMRARGPRARPRMAEALRVHDGRWFPLLRDRRGLGTTGVPYDVSSHPLVAEAVLEGRVLHRSRQELARSLGQDPGAAAEVDAARTGRHAPAAWVAQRLEAWVGGSEDPSTAEAARLLEAIEVPAVRDAAWGRIRRASARDDVHFWSALVRRAPDDLVPHAASVLAFAAWLSGDGALAWCAVDRARELDPAHSLAHLVADLLTGAVPPSEWDAMRRHLRSVS